MKTKNYLLLIVCALIFFSCADSVQIEQCLTDDKDGFWSGLIHGIIAPISFVISLFSDSVSVYSVNNTGGWYDFGFLIGVGGITFGSSR